MDKIGCELDDTVRRIAEHYDFIITSRGGKWWIESCNIGLIWWTWMAPDEQLANFLDTIRLAFKVTPDDLI